MWILYIICIILFTGKRHICINVYLASQWGGACAFRSTDQIRAVLLAEVIRLRQMVAISAFTIYIKACAVVQLIVHIIHLMDCMVLIVFSKEAFHCSQAVFR